MNRASLLRYQAHPRVISGSLVEAVLNGCVIGEICEIRCSWRDNTVVARAQVIGFSHDSTLLSLIGTAQGLSREAVISPTGCVLSIPVSEGLLGCVIDPSGEITERIAGNGTGGVGEMRVVNASPPNYRERQGIHAPFITGIRAIDGLITCGIGQRLGIFASAGCGKTTLMQMLIEQSEADVFVVALIGERGREVTEFVESLKKSKRSDNCILVYATSDYSSVDRCNAALVASTIAEFFRDQGKNVVLVMDSITRYARALRDVALAAGEPPARRGYPASVFEALPRVLERPGSTQRGSITAFYTILLENDDDPDPIAEEIRSILDGHIYLSRQLAAKNHYPAIDILRSLSRVASEVCEKEHLACAGEIRRIMAKIEELQIFVDLGEYKSGEDEQNDRAMFKKEDIFNWLSQPVSDHSDFTTTLREMERLAT